MIGSFQRKILCALGFDRIEGVARSVVDKQNQMHQLVLQLNQRVSELELRNAGLHAALANMIIKNEELLLRLNRSIDTSLNEKVISPESSSWEENGSSLPINDDISDASTSDTLK